MCDDGGGSRATTTEAGGRIDDACTSLGDADIDGSSLAAEAGFGAEVAGSDFRADVAPKEESVGMADELECESVRRRWNAMRRWVWAHFGAQASEASGSAAAAGFSAVAFDSEGGAASADEGKGDGWHEATVTAAAPAEVAGAEI